MTVRKRADQIRPGDRFVFGPDLGGEGEILTATDVAVEYGIVSIWVEERDFAIETTDRRFVTMEVSE